MADYLVTDTELTSVANAIRTKGGTSANLSFPTEFVSAINAIQTGTTPTGIKYVYSDIDGEGAWDVSGYEYCSYDYAPVKDGHLRIWIDLSDITTSTNLTLTFGFNRTSGTVVIDWGDGSTPTTLTASSYSGNRTHEYQTAGIYVVDVTFVSGKVQLFSTPTMLLPRALGIEASALSPNVINGSNFTSWNNATALKKVYIADIISTLGGSIFSGCSSLSSLRLPSTLTAIPVQMCRDCASLESITIPSGVTSIGEYAFHGCESLESITIPSGVTSIGQYAFAYCYGIKEYHILPTTPPTLGAYAFRDIPTNAVIYVPSASLSAYQSASNWSTYASQMVGE